jgi:hypothetical protein
MYPVEFEEDEVIMCEGEIGNVVYIIEGKKTSSNYLFSFRHA